MKPVIIQMYAIDNCMILMKIDGLTSISKCNLNV